MKITKEMMQRLPPEQQEALAAMEIERAMKRQRLLEQVGGNLVMRWLPMLFISLMFCLCFLSFFIPNGRHAPAIIVCIALIPCFLIEFQVASINRRLDALVELLNEEEKERGSGA